MINQSDNSTNSKTVPSDRGPRSGLLTPMLLSSSTEMLRDFYHSPIFEKQVTGDVLIGDFRLEDDAGTDAKWIARFQVSDLPGAMRRALELGGEVVGETETTALLLAPDGSNFALTEMQSPTNDSLSIMSELCSASHDLSTSFYSSLLEAETTVVPDSPHNYRLLVKDDLAFAGVVDMVSLFRENTPARWIPYFHVDALDTCVSLAVDYGALVRVPPTLSEFGVRYAVLADPKNAQFGLREQPREGLFGGDIQ